MTAASTRAPRRPTQRPSPQGAGRPGLCGISTRGSGLPLRIVFHGADGVGKTSLAAQFPAPVFLYPAGDTGLETLLDSGRLANVPHFASVTTWEEVAFHLDQLAEADHAYRTIVVDGLGGFERLCHERVCLRDFEGEWGELGFHGYQRGYEVATAEWRRLLAALDLLRTERQMTVVLLSASRMVPYRNPAGADYDRFCPDLHPKTWSVTQRWADVVGFVSADFAPQGGPRSRRSRGAPLVQRRISVERSIAHDAKNRPGLAASIPLPGDDPATAYAAWQQAVAGVAASHSPRTSDALGGRARSCPINHSAD